MSKNWTFKFRRATAEQWEIKDPVLAAGEPGVEANENGLQRFKIGDGVTPWSGLDFVGESLSEAEIEAIIVDLIGDINQSDSAVADVISDPTSESHGAVVGVVHEETDPPVDLTILFENALY